MNCKVNLSPFFAVQQGYMKPFSGLLLVTFLVATSACADVHQEKTSKKNLTIGTLNLGKQLGIVNVIARDAGQACELDITANDNVLLQTIKVAAPCRGSETFKRFDPNADGFDDFVVISSYGGGPYPNTSAWLYSKEKRRFEIDESYPGGWPTNSNCVVVKSRMSVPSTNSPYTHVTSKYCYADNTWQEQN